MEVVYIHRRWGWGGRPGFGPPGVAGLSPRAYPVGARGPILLAAR
jgi:hypothetical protein